MKLNKRQSYLLTEVLSKEWEKISWSIFSMTMTRDKKGNFEKQWKEKNTRLIDIEYIINECCKVDDYNGIYFQEIKEKVENEKDKEYHKIMCDREL